MLLCGSVELFEDGVVFRATIIIRAPNRIRSQRQRVQEPIREATRPAQIGLAW